MKKKTLLILIIGIIIVSLSACTSIQETNGEQKIFDGYTLFTPLTSNTTYLIDNSGEVIHTWEAESYPGNSVYLLENGNLLRTADPGKNGNEVFTAGGAGGKVQEFDWEGNLVWDFEYQSENYMSHHDIEKLPNGNVLMIAWERKTQEEAIEAGRNPELLAEGELWPDKVIEVKPTGENEGEIVWQWSVWDHLVQDYDAAKENYGEVSEHPELIDINFTGTDEKGIADWTHTNSIDYNEELDQIVLSIHGFNEFWIIDHSTTTQEAAGSTGGNSGKGGDLLYRWGNPQAYQMGNAEDKQLFGQHDAEWIEESYPGEGHILVYNNGLHREGADYSTVEEIKTPVDGTGNYSLSNGKTYGPENPEWTYKANPAKDLYSAYISGSQRLPNGNTLIISGSNGEFREVTREGEVVWTYTNPYGKEKENKVMKENAVFKAERYAPNYPGLEKLKENN